MNRDLKIAISTTRNFYEYSLPILLSSLLEVNIDPKNIFVFINGLDEKNTNIIDDITYYGLDHNSYEYSPLIDICENELKAEYWFLIHDTCRVGANFKNLLYNIPSYNPEKIALKEKPCMSIGLYKYNYLLSNKDKLLSIKNKDYSPESLMYWKRWGVPNEDYLLWMTGSPPEIYNNDPRWAIVDYNNWYNTGTLRRTEYYYSLDIYKNKSNWGQTGDNMCIKI